MDVHAKADGRAGSPSLFSRALGIVLILSGVALAAMGILAAHRPLSSAALGGAVLMSGFMVWTDPKRRLRRRLTFAGVGAVLMIVYLLSR
jgi:hypothetical protein